MTKLKLHILTLGSPTGKWSTLCGLIYLRYSRLLTQPAALAHIRFGLKRKLCKNCTKRLDPVEILANLEI